ncbi:Periplasmic pH-dependent serine endoprotease DegQ [bacterium HR17]|uniref:Periplasmic pH-dependent serine endoprotease DegQ n=1 Tax=Candidatus Fervidibacter japonicus TaxID=2035412 RepID=A0A2H5X969_9BACT|nr:Periplasmic pH-dependent serine endoprotease DegQ [bacterium HR17]
MRRVWETPRGQMTVLALTVAVSLALGAMLSRLFLPLPSNLTAQTNPTVAAPPRNALQVAESLQDAFAWVAERVEPSTVTVLAPRTRAPALRFRFPPTPEPDPFEEFFRRFFERGIPSPGERPQERSQPPQTELAPRGSGVIVSADGYILTNRHVIEGVDRIVIALWNNQRFEAKVVGADEFTDIAVLKIEPGGTRLVPAVLGDSDKVRVGDWAIALGNPFGLRQTMTVGVVSAIGRSPRETGAGIGYTEFIQTDAAINQGNSGGPLCNIRGEVIGINTAILSPTGGSIGIGFAIPINTAKFVMEQLLKRGKVVRGWLGVELMDVEQLPDPAALGLKELRGVVVNEVIPNSPAAQAGIKPQDVIVEYNGVPVRNIAHLQMLVGRTAPGTTVPIKIVRGGKELTVQVQIGELTEEALAAATGSAEWRGMVVGELTPELRRQLNLPDDVKGVVVMAVRPGTPAAQAGIRQGDIVMVLANQEVSSVREFQRVTRTLRANRSVPVTIRRDNATTMLIVPPEGR